MERNYSSDLYHHGILGMKWGVRRYQNKDGSLTTAGKRRMNKEDKERAAFFKNKKTKTEEEKPKPKTVKEMSDAELREKTNRMRLENYYVRESNTMRDLNPKQVSKGKQFVDKVMSEVITPAVTDVGRQVFKSYLVKGVNEGLKLDDELKVYTNNKKKN
jgi:hypothetical protein